jgi:hypothetical protein
VCRIRAHRQVVYPAECQRSAASPPPRREHGTATAETATGDRAVTEAAGPRRPPRKTQDTFAATRRLRARRRGVVRLSGQFPSDRRDRLCVSQSAMAKLGRDAEIGDR